MEFVVIIIGIFVGSFLNVIVDRMIRYESFWSGRSYCEHCHKNLAWHDLIPLLSFVYLQGKCRYCKTPIGYWYPMIELITGALFVITYQKIMNYELGIRSGLDIFFYLYIVSSMIVIFFTDLKYGIIPDKILFPAIVVSFLSLIPNSQFLIPNLLSAIGACLLFLLLFIGTKGKGMGFGDVKFAFLMGLLLGFPKIVIALYIAFLTGAIISSILVLIGKKKLKGGTVPFGPFLVFGTIVSLFYGDIILSMVLNLF